MRPAARSFQTASLIALFALSAHAGGCGRERRQTDRSCADEKTQSVSYSFAYRLADIAASSEVRRRITPEGAEVIGGATEVRLPGEPHPMSLAEAAEIDATGRLILATSELRRGARGRELLRSVRLDAVRGLVTVRTAEGETSWSEATDFPWLHERAFVSVAPEMASVTPVQAWIARRAAEAGARLRVIDIDARSSYLTIPSQVVLDDGASRWVVLGDEAVEIGPGFVRDLPWRALQTAATSGVARRPSSDLARLVTPELLR